MGKHWRFCGTSWMNMKVIHEPDCYGKDNSRKFIRTWMGQGTNLGMYVCSSKTRVISVSFRGWHLNGWREAENGSHVAEIDARRWSWRTRIISWPCTFGMCSAWMQTKWNTYWTAQGDVESRISAGATEKLPGREKPHAKTVAWSYDMEGQAQKCVEWYCELARIGAALQRFKSVLAWV